MSPVSVAALRAGWVCTNPCVVAKKFPEGVPVKSAGVSLIPERHHVCDDAV